MPYTITPTLNNNDAESFSSDFDLATLSDADATALLIDSHRILLSRINDDAERIYSDSFSDDDTDYFPARATILSHLTSILCDIDTTHADSMRRFFDDHEICIDLLTCDLDMPISIHYAD
jgi:hypothetical protein